VISSPAPSRPQAKELANRLKEPRRFIPVGGDGIDVGTFLSKPATHWLKA